VKIDSYVINEYNENLISDNLVTMIEKQMVFIENPLKKNSVRDLLKEYFTEKSNAKFLIIKDVDIIGFAFFNVNFGFETKGKYLWLNELHIEEKYQKKGYGTLIMERLVRYCETNNIKKILGLLSKDNTASSYYQKNNFSLNDYFLLSRDIE